LILNIFFGTGGQLLLGLLICAPCFLHPHPACLNVECAVSWCFVQVRGGRPTGWRSRQSDTSYTEYCWQFWTNHLKSRLQLNHVPVHETHSA